MSPRGHPQIYLGYSVSISRASLGTSCEMPWASCGLSWAPYGAPHVQPMRILGESHTIRVYAIKTFKQIFHQAVNSSNLLRHVIGWVCNKTTTKRGKNTKMFHPVACTESMPSSIDLEHNKVRRTLLEHVHERVRTAAQQQQ